MGHLIYACMIVPILAVVFMAWKFPKRTAWWELILIFAVPAIAIVISKFVSVATLTTDTEYWNTHAVKATYYEYWEEWDHKTCTREDCSGSGKNRTCHTVTYDCSECDHHPARWVVEDNTGKQFNIDKSRYTQIVRRWENETFVDLGRSITHGGFGCGKDGDAYVTTYSGDFDRTVPICKQHRYTNKVQCSKSVFNYTEVDSETVAMYGLYRYPNYEKMGIFNYDPIMGATDPDASRLLSYHNAHIGNAKQVHMMLVVFHDQPVEAATWQEAHWKNGNKNEFILCLGERGGKVDWAKVISWTDVEDLKVRVARKARELGAKKMDLSAIVTMMAGEVKRGYIRKQFADFSYIKVEPTLGAVMWTFLITILVTVGVCVFAVLNPWDR